MELCSFGPVSEICSSLSKKGLHLNEDQITYIIKVELVQTKIFSYPGGFSGGTSCFALLAAEFLHPQRY